MIPPVRNNPKMALASLVLSAVGLVGLVQNEGYTDKAVIPTKGDVPTIGFGTTEGVKLGDTTTPVKALQRSLEFVQRGEAKLKSCVHVPLSQVEYDIYVDMLYNIGPDAFCGSTMVKRLNQLDYQSACKAIVMWNRVGAQRCDAPGNKVCWGLWERRLASRDKCLEAQ